MKRRRFRYRFRFDNVMVGTFGTAFVMLSGLMFMAGMLIGNVPPHTRAIVRPAPVERIELAAFPVLRAEKKPAPIAQARFAFTWTPPIQTQTIAQRTAPYRDLIHEAAMVHDLPVELVEAIIKVESGFDPLTVSRKGALGLMQVMPRTAERFGVARTELFDPRRNVAAGTAYMAFLIDRYRNLDLALAAYNAGEGAVDQYGGIPPYRETQQYVKKVRKALGV